VTPLLDVHLKEVAQVVERGCAGPQQRLLFDRGRLGVALRDDEAAQCRAMLARHLLPRRLAAFVAKADAPVGRDV